MLLDDPLPLDPDMPELLSRLRSGELDELDRDDDPDEPWSFLFRPKTHVYHKDKHIGYFMKKRFSVGGGLHIYDEADKYLGEVAGSWKGGKFTFKSEKGKELGVI